MAQKTFTELVCDICNKKHKAEDLTHSVSVDVDIYNEVCDKCAERFISLAERIINPPKRAKKAKPDKKAEA